MRKTLVLAVLALLVLASLPLAQAADTGEGKWTFNGQIRTREEHLENYADFSDDGVVDPNNKAINDLVDFMPYRARMGVNGALANNVSVAFQVQSFGVWGFNGDPRQSSSFPPDQQNFATSPEDTNLYQANVMLSHFIGKDFTLVVGRQEHSEGTGLIFGNEEFYNGTVYDGVTGEWKFKSWELSGLAFVINEQFAGGLTQAPGSPIGSGGCTACGSEDTRVWGATGHLHFGEKTKSDLDVYAYDSYEGTPGTPFGKPHMQTYGAHWWRMPKNAAEAKKAHLDWNLEIAAQAGDVTDPNNDTFDTSGSIFDGSIGWSFTPGKAVHRVYVGAIAESGDDDQTDDKIDGWNDLFMSVHGRFGGADFFGSNFNGNLNGISSGNSAAGAGITATRVGWTGTFKDGKHTVGVILWNFVPTEDEIKDSATTKLKIEDYGSEIDAGYKYRYTDNVTFGAGFAQLSPDDGLTGGSGAPSDAVLRVVGVMDVKWK